MIYAIGAYAWVGLLLSSYASARVCRDEPKLLSLLVHTLVALFWPFFVLMTPMFLGENY